MSEVNETAMEAHLEAQFHRACATVPRRNKPGGLRIGRRCFLSDEELARFVQERSGGVPNGHCRDQKTCLC